MAVFSCVQKILERPHLTPKTLGLQPSAGKVIAKNTAMLYFRMLLTMAVSLYTSRIVLNTLGVEDYGIYCVVGGVVTMLGFLSSAMSSGTQRFLSYELGKKDFERLARVFSMSINIHLVIAGLIFVLAETFGLWFLNTQLTIPVERIGAANWVYQLSILTFMVSVFSVPYNALLIAHERMTVYAYVSIAEVSLKLSVVLMLQWLGSDKLILYAVLVFLVSLLIRGFLGAYCKKNFGESKYQFNWEPKLFRQMFSHSGWMLLGTSTNILAGQGINMLMNVFFGVGVNAARGVAYQLQGAVYGFASNLMMAARPQIIKNYAQNKLNETYKLVFSSSKFSFYLLFFIALPVLLVTETVIEWWLKIIPEHVVVFTRLTIFNLFFVTLFPSIAAVSQASGRIKHYQLVVSASFVFVFALSFLLFKLGYPSHYAFVIMILISFLGLMARLLVMKIQLSFPVQDYFKKVLLKIIFVTGLSVPAPLAVLFLVENQTMQFFGVCVASIFSTAMAIWGAGLEQDERSFAKSQIKKYFKKLLAKT